MKYTKIISSLVLAGAFVFSSSLMAADDAKKDKKKKPAAGEKAKGKKGGRQNPILSLKGLTDDQKKELGALMKDTQAKQKAAGKDRDARRKVYQGMQAKLKDILTEDQLKELQQKRSQGRKGKGGDAAKGKGKGKKKD